MSGAERPRPAARAVWKAKDEARGGDVKRLSLGAGGG